MSDEPGFETLRREGVYYQRDLHPRTAGHGIGVHALLFLLTALTTTFAGIFMSLDAIHAFKQEPSILYVLSNPHFLIYGLPFSVSLLAILGVHEMGHYVASRRWQVRASLPYFIPFPSLIGTLGAVIRIRSRIPNRRALIDIGASGPLAGFAMSVIALCVGLHLSPRVELTSMAPGSVTLGDSLLSSWLASVIVGDLAEGYDLFLHPIAFAGWLGMFVTVLNLLPVGQFDGGHIVYALFGRRHELVSKLTILFLALFWAAGPPYDWLTGDLSFSLWLETRWPGWLVWIVIAVLLGRRHPPPFDSVEGLNSGRKGIGLVSLVIFLICFIPRPFTITF